MQTPWNTWLFQIIGGLNRRALLNRSIFNHYFANSIICFGFDSINKAACHHNTICDYPDSHFKSNQISIQKIHECIYTVCIGRPGLIKSFNFLLSLIGGNYEGAAVVSLVTLLIHTGFDYY